MPKPKKSAEFAARPSLPSAVLGEPGDDLQRAATVDADARYAEYLRVLDEVPVLLDVVSEPPRVVVRDFRLGQRPNVRKSAREDAYSVRERQVAELACCYAEYALRGEEADLDEPAPAAAKKKAKRPKRGKRAKRRKR